MLFNKTSLGTYLKPALRCLFSVLLAMGIASAFPPAPYYTLYGMVRDQVGQTVTADGAPKNRGWYLAITGAVARPTLPAAAHPWCICFPI